MRKVVFKMIIMFLFIFSCKGMDMKKEKATYEILSTVYKTLTIRIPPPPAPWKINGTLQDSINAHKEVIEFKKKAGKRKLIIAVDPYLYASDSLSIDPDELPQELKDLIGKLSSFTIRKHINIRRIRADRNDSIIRFEDHLLEKNIKDYLKFNKRVNFSRIAFNEKFTSAAVIGNVSTSSLAGMSALFYLKKRNDSWEIIKIVLLSIS